MSGFCSNCSCGTSPALFFFSFCSLALATRSFGPDHMVTSSAHLSLGETLRLRGRLAEAEREFRTSLAIREHALGARSALPGWTKASLGKVLTTQRRYAEAEGELLDGLAIEDQLGINPQHPEYQRLLLYTAELYEATNRSAEAARYRARLAAANQ